MANCQLYCIFSPSRKRYFGITSQPLKSRWNGHTHFARKGNPARLYRAIRKYGAAAMMVKTMAVGTRPYILDLEIKAIAAYQTQKPENGYNQYAGGQGSYNYPVSNETRAKLALASTGRKLSKETIERMRLNATGQKKPEGFGALMSAIQKGKKGRPWSEKMKESLPAKISASKHAITESTREKMRVSAIGRPLSKEARAKVSEALKGNSRAKGKTWKVPNRKSRSINA